MAKKKTTKKVAPKEDVKEVVAEPVPVKETKPVVKEETLFTLLDDVRDKVYGGDAKLADKAIKNFLKSKLNTVK
jgi:hypothetical protein